MYYLPDSSECQTSDDFTAEDSTTQLRGIDVRFDLLVDYVDRGWSIVPQLPGEKKPCFRWKQYQTTRPSVIEVRYWFDRWPDSGPALILGPLSGVLAVDVDGEDAHRELVRRLGKVPTAPKVLSGSGAPYRYHLFFSHPPFATRAKATPWHKHLEFRGHGGIIILPPALHKSGKRYRWAPGKSLSDIPLPALPEAIIAALRKRLRPAVPSQPPRNSSVILIPGISRKTRVFLSGRYASSPGWNDRLFRAACDLAGNGMSLEKATPLLLQGAGPWNQQEEAKALATIQSAYASPRVPARAYAGRRRSGD